jgi:glutathione S-transferase
MIIIHHLNNSRSQRILWMCEEIGIDYQIKHYQRDSKTQLAPQELFDVHPLGKSPVITDGDVTVAESGAIIEYLAQNYGKDLIPELGTDEYRQYIYWLHFAEGSLMPQMLLKLIFDKIKTSPMPFFVKPIAKGIANKVIDGYVGPNIKSNMKFIENHLNENIWFTGDKLSGADIQMSFPLEAAMAGNKSGGYPAIQKYVDKIHSRSAYKKALEKGGPYDYA